MSNGFTYYSACLEKMNMTNQCGYTCSFLGSLWETSGDRQKEFRVGLSRTHDTHGALSHDWTLSLGRLFRVGTGGPALRISLFGLSVFPQDVDAAYMSKVELQAKVDALDREIKFFKCLYEGVRSLFHPLGI